MPTFVYDFVDAVDSYDESIACVSGAGISLRTVDDLGRYDPHGTVADYAIVTFSDVSGKGITEFFAFKADENVPSGCSIGYQLSTDGGSTYYYVDSGNWVASDDEEDETQYSDWLTIDTYVQDLSFNRSNPQIRVRAYFASSDSGQSSPVLESITITYEAQFALFSDIQQSLAKHIEDNLAIPHFVCFNCNDATSEISLVREADRVDIISVDEVSNFSTGEKLTFTYDFAEKLITLDVSQPSGTVLRVDITTKPNISIISGKEYTLAKPHELVIEVNNVDRSADPGFSNAIIAEKSRGKEKARIRLGPKVWDIEVAVSCVSALKHYADAMASEVERLMDNAIFQAYALPVYFQAIDMASVINLSTPKDNTWGLGMLFYLRVMYPNTSYYEVPLLQSLEIIYGTQSKTWARRLHDLDSGDVDHEEVYN